MKIIIDTSSLLAFIRYYLPFDKSGSLKNFIENKFNSSEILILDKIYEQSTYIAQGKIIKELDFIKESDKIVKTAEILPDKKFFNLLENQFCNKNIRKLKNITDIEYEDQKNKFLEDADAKMILYCYHENKNKKLFTDELFLITEETAADNDNKLFKKLPKICEIQGIECCTLPVLLKNHYNMDLGDYLK